MKLIRIQELLILCNLGTAHPFSKLPNVAAQPIENTNTPRVSLAHCHTSDFRRGCWTHVSPSRIPDVLQFTVPLIVTDYVVRLWVVHLVHL